MDFGSVGDYFEVALSKRLSAVDVDSRISHQHELGGFAKLRPLLGDSRRRVDATYAYVSDAGVEVERGFTTWYNSREGKPRPPEYRLYYPDNAPVSSAREGDLTLACLSKDGGMVFLFVEGGSDAETDVEWLFGIGEQGERFDQTRDLGRRVDATGAAILSALGIEVERPMTLDEAIARMFDRWPDSFPTGRELSAYAREVVGIDPRDDPDSAVVDWYNTQTTLFMGYEGEDRERRLGPLVRDVSDPDYDAILREAMSIFQRRRSSAGHALEYHLEALFDAHGISYTAQGQTEGKEKPDFLFPSVDAYRDDGFPSSRLTLLGAKTTAKDRWGQVLKEGSRVERKHLVTLEPAITEAQTSEMDRRGLQLVVPRPIQATYSPAQRSWLWSLSDFCKHVLELQK